MNLEEQPSLTQLSLKSTTTFRNECPSCHKDYFCHFRLERLISSRSKHARLRFKSEQQNMADCIIVKISSGVHFQKATAKHEF